MTRSLLGEEREREVIFISGAMPLMNCLAYAEALPTVLAGFSKLCLKEGLSAQFLPICGILSAELWALSPKKLRR